MENMNDNSPNETESEKTETTEEAMNLASLSDEEILNMEPDMIGSTDVEDDTSTQSPGSEDEEGQSAEDTDGADSDEPSSEDEEGGDSTFEEESDAEGNAESSSDTDEDPFDGDQPEKKKTLKPEEVKDATNDVDYKSEYERALEPFKASGRTVTPKSMEELRRLAQMGYDYGNKMAAMKPVQRLVATLEKHELTDLNDISYLIDLKKGNREAIRKLIKENNIDPMEFSDDEGGTYSPTDHSVSEAEAETSQVLDSIKNSSVFRTTLQHISQMDTGSKKLLQDNPGMIKALNDHVEEGFFDMITQEVNHQKALGELSGLSDLQAYMKVGNAMQAAGAFDKPQDEATSPSPEKSQRSAQDSGSRSSDKEESLRNRKRAASPPRGKPKAGKQKIDLNKLSDDEIMNLDPSAL